MVCWCARGEPRGVRGEVGALVVVVDLEPNLTSSGFGRFHKLALNFARLSSRETACRNVRTMVLDVVNGRRLGIRPTESTVSLQKFKEVWWIINERITRKREEGHTKHPRTRSPRRHRTLSWIRSTAAIQYHRRVCTSCMQMGLVGNCLQVRGQLCVTSQRGCKR